MPYPEIMIHGMRQELAQLGIEEAKTSEAVSDAVANTEGTLMVVVNSVCGCAAGGVRPGIAMALQNSEAKPDRLFEGRKAGRNVRTSRPGGPSAADHRPIAGGSLRQALLKDRSGEQLGARSSALTVKRRLHKGVNCRYQSRRHSIVDRRLWCLHWWGG